MLRTTHVTNLNLHSLRKHFEGDYEVTTANIRNNTI